MATGFSSLDITAKTGDASNTFRRGMHHWTVNEAKRQVEILQLISQTPPLLENWHLTKFLIPRLLRQRDKLGYFSCFRKRLQLIPRELATNFPVPRLLRQRDKLVYFSCFRERLLAVRASNSMEYDKLLIPGQTLIIQYGHGLSCILCLIWHLTLWRAEYFTIVM